MQSLQLTANEINVLIAAVELQIDTIKEESKDFFSDITEIEYNREINFRLELIEKLKQSI